jgi:SAM-dependent methyltransferase
MRDLPRLSDEQRSDLANALRRTYFTAFGLTYLGSPAFAGDLADHVDGRYRHFAGDVVPWLQRHLAGLATHSVAEVGSGTGSSTAALAPHVREISTFEIEENSIAAAKARAEILGYRNVTHCRSLFTADEAMRIGVVDGVMLAAVLEHCTFDECIGLLRASWEALKPGGWLCVVDTPNRLCPVDYHTSFLPFYSMLPIEVRIAYACRSPRPEFGQTFPGEDDAMRMTRWGCGISYHEFELGIGPDVHSMVIADGWEREIEAAIGILPEDAAAEGQIKAFAPNVNRAFARRTFYFVLRKPLTPPRT